MIKKLEIYNLLENLKPQNIGELMLLIKENLYFSIEDSTKNTMDMMGY